MATNTYVALSTQTVGTAVSSVTFSPISSAYTDLVLVMQLNTSSLVDGSLRFNGDTGNNYSVTRLYGGSGGAFSDRFSNISSILIGDLSTNTDSATILQIQNYSNTNVNKTVLVRANPNGRPVFANVGLWRNTAAITSITLTSSANFAVGSTFTLYGISNVGDASPKATGGDVYSDASYWYHAFPMSGNFVPNQSLTADILVVAGGGGGGTWNGGGGGAGGLLYYSSQSLTATNYQVLIGGGGAGSSTNAVKGSTGATSQFGSLTSAAGGGGGGSNDSSTGASGASGGGGAGSGGASTTGGSATNGNSGGNGLVGGNYSGGGGGGFGTAGSNGSTSYPSGQGGNGVNTYSSWLSVTGFGDSGYIVAGGGGGRYDTSGRNPGGSGGGGQGGTTVPADKDGTNGLAYSGSGGGGGAYGQPTGGQGNGGNGGSGLVIVRYAK